MSVGTRWMAVIAVGACLFVLMEGLGYAQERGLGEVAESAIAPKVHAQTTRATELRGASKGTRKSVVLGRDSSGRGNDAKPRSRSEPNKSDSGDPKLTVKLGGRLFLDGAMFWNRSTTPASGMLGNGVKIGAARLRVQGKYGNWGFQFQYDFTDTGAQGIKFAYLQYNGFKARAIRIGNQFEQFGLENRTSTSYMTFLGHSPAFAAIGVGPRHLGVALTGLDGPFHWGVGVYGPVPGYTSTTEDGSQGVDVATRLLFDPVASHRRLLHFGVSARYHKYGSGNSGIGNHNDSVLGAHAGFPLSGLFPVLIAARAPGSKPGHMMNYDVEFAATLRSLSVQGEYYLTRITGLHGLGQSTAKFRGYYGQVSYFLTGESRRFVRTSFYDIFVGTHPEHPVDQGGPGAWEIAARYSMADLNSGSITGGEERDITLGLNWTPVYHLRFMLDAMRVLPIRNGRNRDASFDVIALRTVVFW